jgi:3-methyladenine DNA glycosylase AlkD
MSRNPLSHTLSTPMKKLAREIQQSLTAMPTKDARTFHLVRREWSNRIKSESGPSVILLAKDLVLRGLWERILAYELLEYHPGAREVLRPKDVTALGRGMKSWGEVDCFARYVAGPAWREGNIPTRLIHSWAHSSDHWWRRAALVSSVPLNNRTRGGQGDVARTLGVCRLLVRDREDMVVKALSWALRELSMRDQAAVERFLARHAERLAPRVSREVTHKLRTGLKNPRRVSAK